MDGDLDDAKIGNVPKGARFYDLLGWSLVSVWQAQTVARVESIWLWMNLERESS